jgi:pimeloyl-ACP methyl ester carboxylesterase
VKTFRAVIVGALALLIAAQLPAEEIAEPRTGFFQVAMTPVDVVGVSGAQDFADILPPDQVIEWQLNVPMTYADNPPPGVVVYVSPLERGGPPRNWSALLNEKNLLWIGANNAGNAHPVAERMLKAMLATAVLEKLNYVVAADRIYVAGLSGGGQTATRVMSARPEQFRGGIYMAGTVSWGEQLPPKIDLIRQKRHVFMVGTYDPALQSTQRVYREYIEAGVTNSRVMTIRNFKHRMPPGEYFVKAVEYLDDEE